MVLLRLRGPIPDETDDSDPSVVLRQTPLVWTNLAGMVIDIPSGIDRWRPCTDEELSYFRYLELI